jgi:hypothetical protein
MPPIKFEVDIEDHLMDGLSSAINAELAADPQKREKIAKFAIAQVLGWMAGRSSFQSITEQQTEWLAQLFPLFFEEEAPTAERIFNNFGVPYGRAAYISRILLEKQNSVWRAKGRALLRIGLIGKMAEATQNIAEGDAFRYVPISLDNIAYRELTVILEEIFRADPTLAPPVNRAVSPGRRTVDIPSQLFEQIIARLSS